MSRRVWTISLLSLAVAVAAATLAVRSGCLLAGPAGGGGGTAAKAADAGTGEGAGEGTGAATPTTAPARDPRWARPLTLAGVGNLHKINDTVYRSEQPTAEGMRNLEKLGIKTVVSLRAFHSDEDELKGTGLQTRRLYIKTWHIEQEDAVAFLKIVTDPANQPILVHCQHGADRTGTMCAVYRVAVQGWSKADAIRELTDGGYGYHPVWTNLKPWLEAMDISAIRRQAGLEPPAAPSASSTRPAASPAQ